MLSALVVIATLASAPPDSSRAQATLGGDYWKGTDVAPGEVWGVADLHAHFFNFLGFGGRVLHGAPWAPHGMRQALSGCAPNHGYDGQGGSLSILPEPGHRSSGYPSFEGWPRYDTLVHQQAYLDWVRRAWQGGLRLVQMDVQNTGFLGTAYELANGLFVQGNRSPVPRDDASALSIQVGAARLLFEGGPAADFAAIAYSPAQARRIIASGKLAVVLGIEVEALGNYTQAAQLGSEPRKAIQTLVASLWDSGIRHVIPIHLTRNAFGHPAVFNPALNAMNYADTGQYYATGDAFDAGLRFDPNLTHRDAATTLVELAGHLCGDSPFPPARAIAATEGLTEAGTMLVDALMQQGFIVDVEHMSQPAVETTLALAERRQVPVMSSHTQFRDLSFGTAISYQDGGYEAQPLPQPMAQDVTGQYGTSDALKVRTDRSRTREQVDLIRRLGGMVGVSLVSQSVGVSWRQKVPLDCDGSSKGFLQALLYADEMMPGGAGQVAIASDVGGFATLPAPRFGVEACPGARGDAVRSAGGRIRAQALAQRNGVQYQTPVASVGPWRFERRGSGDEVAYSGAEVQQWLAVARQAARPQTPLSGNAQAVVLARWQAMTEGPNTPMERSVAGRREFDINLDGVAHYGMLPDFFQDTANVARAAGVSEELKPLFRSAEFYLQMWERIERRRGPVDHIPN